jgi:hypothetical protein
MKKLLLFMTLVITLTISTFVFADPNELSDKEMVERSDRLDAINDKLQQSLPDKERAELLFEKVQLMFTAFGPLYLRTPTESLLEAIEIEPNKKEYKEFLAEVYNFFWKDRDFSEDDQISKDLLALKERCKRILERYSE